MKGRGLDDVDTGVGQAGVEDGDLRRRQFAGRFHPADGTDGRVVVGAQFRSGLRDAQSVVDEDVGVEQDYSHSARNSRW